MVGAPHERNGRREDGMGKDGTGDPSVWSVPDVAIHHPTQGHKEHIHHAAEWKAIKN